MFLLAKEKIRTIVSISIDCPEEGWQHQLKNYSDPFLFLTKDNQLFSYIRLKDFLLTSQIEQSITIKNLVENSVPLENVCKLNETISLPLLFQIIGEPIALVKNKQEEVI
ncbi:Fis family transcriptional regulator, partial [Priestia megaterium]